jgi:hypothetical protein
MVGESGLPTGPADRGLAQRLRSLRVILLLAVLSSASGCVYFNALYNANRLFNQGVDEIEDGRESSGRVTLGAAIEKAERIVQNKPNSRWADDALRLVVRARYLREEWPELAEASRQLLGYARSARDTAHALGYIGQAELNLGNAAAADSLITVALEEEREPARRADLLADRGRARGVMGQTAAADADFQAVSALRPQWATPRIDRVRMLLGAGQYEKAAVEFGVLLTLTFSDREERAVIELAQYAAAVDPPTAVKALAAVESSSLLPNNKAELMKLRADTELVLGHYDKARADLYLTTAMAQDSRAAAEAQATLIGLELRDIASLAGYDSLMSRIENLAAQPAGRRSEEVRTLHENMVKVDYWIASGALGLMAAAEAARDLLRAPRLARRLFLMYADAQPGALWAPKAILAALYLTPLDSTAQATADASEPTAQELRQRLLDDYEDSAYVQAYFGGDGGRFTFEELEQGLRQQLERLNTLAEREVRARRSGSTQ